MLFVVDSTDHARFHEAKIELHRALSHPQLDSATLLVLANKQDIDGGKSREWRHGRDMSH